MPTQHNWQCSRLVSDRLWDRTPPSAPFFYPWRSTQVGDGDRLLTCQVVSATREFEPLLLRQKAIHTLLTLGVEKVWRCTWVCGKRQSESQDRGTAATCRGEMMSVRSLERYPSGQGAALEMRQAVIRAWVRAPLSPPVIWWPQLSWQSTRLWLWVSRVRPSSVTP